MDMYHKALCEEMDKQNIVFNGVYCFEFVEQKSSRNLFSQQNNRIIIISFNSSWETDWYLLLL